MPCTAQPCHRSPYTRCPDCHQEICSDHAEDCEACGRTFCHACYRRHAAQLEEAG